MIVTYYKTDIMIGELEPKKPKELKELRDELLKRKSKYFGLHETKSQELAGFSSVLSQGFMRQGDKLIHQFITENYDSSDDCLYTRKEYEYCCLNSILLFTSLLGKLDLSFDRRYDPMQRRLIEEAISSQIVDCSPLNYIWKNRSKSMMEAVYSEIDARGIKNPADISDPKKLAMMDLRIFRYALMTGIISYEVSESISFDQRVDKPIIKSSMYDPNQVPINNALLLYDDSLLEKHIRMRKK